MEEDIKKETDRDGVARCRKETREHNIKPREGGVSRRREKAGQPNACEGQERQGLKTVI